MTQPARSPRVSSRTSWLLSMTCCTALHACGGGAPEPSPPVPPAPAPAPPPGPTPPGPVPGPLPGGAGPSGGPDGACDESYASAAEYAASPRRSTGVDPGHGGGARPTFVANRVSATLRTFAASGHETGGTEIHRGFVLNFDEAGNLRWGRSLSHCQIDEVESVGVWNDGALAATTTYQHEGVVRTDLLKFSPSGEIVWRHLVAQDSCGAVGCYHNVHSELEVDHHDGSVVVAVRGTGDTLTLVRVSAAGAEMNRRNVTPEMTSVDQMRLASLAVFEPGSLERHSDVLVGLSNSAMLFTSEFNFVWNQRVPGAAQVEVAMCVSDRYTLAAVGEEYMSDEHVIASYSKAGVPQFSWRVAGEGDTRPAYGVIRGSVFNLACNEQNTPDLVMHRSDGGREFHREIVGLMLLNDGVIHGIYDATFAEPAFFAGSAGVGVSRNALLLNDNGKFKMVAGDRVGWTRRGP